MTAQAAAIAPTIAARAGNRPFLGFGTLLRKELTEWRRGKGALVIAGISIATAIFTTVVPFITPKGQGPVLSLDPTANVLLGWTGLTAAVVALIASMTLITGERDRGTLPWILTKPVSPVSVLAAKWTAAMLVYGVLGVIIPLAVSAGVATVAYGGVPKLDVVATFALLYLTVPAFFIALTIALGTFVKSTGGVAGIGFLVLLAPMLVGGAVPILRDISPTNIGAWALATATGQATSVLTLIGWLVAMVALAISARIVFNRQEF
jgi:ABC-2 type transport system permease protein